jgi:hypothetical protein
VQGHGWGDYAPGVNQSGVMDYLAGHHLLLSHARAWRIYDQNYRNAQGGTLKIDFISSCVIFCKQYTLYDCSINNNFSFKVGIIFSF